MIEHEPTIDPFESPACGTGLEADQNALRAIKLNPALLKRMISPLESPTEEPPLERPKASTPIEIWDLPVQGQLHH